MPASATTTFLTPLGMLTIRSSSRGITHVAFGDDGTRASTVDADPDAMELVQAARAQLAAYFAGTRRTFDGPLDPAGTAFQRRVWEALRAIPAGETRSYAGVAREIGLPSAVRAVGAANGANPIAIIIPCHRVIAADGSLHGYGGGPERKRWLLEHEGALGRLTHFAARS